MKVKKERGNVPRILVGQIRLTKAPTVKVPIRIENHALGQTEALLDYGADISIADLNFLKRMGLLKEANGSIYLGCKSK